MAAIGIAALVLAAVGVLCGIAGVLFALSASRRRVGHRFGVLAVISGTPLLVLLLIHSPCFSLLLCLSAIGCGTLAIRTARRDTRD